MRKVYLDCGGQKAITIKNVIDEYKGFEFHSFEPNPSFFSYYDKYKERNVKLHKVAVWIHDGEIEYYPAVSDGAGTLYKDKTTGGVKRNPIKVKCIDFSKWIIENFNKRDYIIVHMDIEGSEYPVLKKMLKDNSISYINSLNCEFHYKKIPSISKKEHYKLIAILTWKKLLLPQINTKIIRSLNKFFFPVIEIIKKLRNGIKRV